MAPEPQPRKTIRSYRLVFRRRWRIFRIQGWRIPLPGGLELRLLAYWLACLVLISLLARLPLFGAIVSATPASLRLLALPIAAAWLLSRWEIDGRPPHRALAGLLAWWLRPRALAGMRRIPAEQTQFAPLGELALAPDLAAPRYPRGRLRGPARLLLRHPVSVVLEQVPRRIGSQPRQRAAAARLWRLRATSHDPLHNGKTIDVPAGRTVVFEGEER
jgi:hypothetical protein